MTTAVLIGAFTAVLGSLLVSLDTDELTTLLGPAAVARRLPADRWRSAVTGKELAFPAVVASGTSTSLPDFTS
jgi:hypothetical protein